MDKQQIESLTFGKLVDILFNLNLFRCDIKELDFDKSIKMLKEYYEVNE